MAKLNIYRKTPSGFRLNHLAAAKNEHPSAFRMVVLRLSLALGLGFWGIWEGAPVPALLFLASAVLILSGLTFVRRSAQGAIELPALVLESQRKWDNRVRSTWTLRSKDMAGHVQSFVTDVSSALGDPVVRAIENDGSEEETFVELALAERDRPFIVAWTDSRTKGSVAVTPEVSGIWLRVDPQGENELGAVVVADVGEFEQRMCSAITLES